MTVASLVLLAMLLPFTSTSIAMEPGPLARYRWTHRLLIVHVPDTGPGRKTLESLRTALETRMADVMDRDLLIVPVGELTHAATGLRPAVDLDAAARLAVRQRLGLRAGETQLVLLGKDGGVKARQSGAQFDLDAIFALVDRMPMRRLETRRR